jgi:type IV secretion system protein VirD4
MRAVGSFFLRFFGAIGMIGGGIASLLLALAPSFWAQVMARYTEHELLLQPPLWLAVLVTVAGVVAIVTVSDGPIGLKKTKESTSHGSARFATTKEVRALGHRFRGVVLCMELEAVMVPLLSPTGKHGWSVVRERPFIATDSLHVLVEGPTGVGKGEAVAYPTLLTDVGRSYVVLDPKGELYDNTAGHRSTFTHVFRFAPTEENSARFNPLLSVAVGTMREVTDAERMANVLCGAVKDERDSSYFYSESAQPLLAAGILYALHNFKGRDRSLPGVSRLIAHGDQKEIVDRICAGLPESAVELRGMLHRLQDDKKTLISAFTTCLNALKFCRMPLVAEAISGSDFEPRDLFAQDAPITVYLVFPFKDAKVLRPLGRLMIDVMLGSHGKDYKHGTVYFLDEFPTLGNIPAISSGIAEIRSYGVQIVALIQSEAQLFAAYGKEGAETIIDNCRARVTMGVVSQKSTENASARIGKTTIVRPRQTQAVSKKSFLETTITNTTGEGEQARELRTPDEVRAAAGSEVFVELPELRVYCGKRAPRYALPELMRLSQLPPPPIKPRSALRRVV